jgi:hypothetical protein
MFHKEVQARALAAIDDVRISRSADLADSSLHATHRKHRGGTMKKFLIGILALLVANVALAEGSFWNARITKIRVDQNGWGMVYFDVDALGTRPSCVASDTARALAFNANTAGGRAILALAESAKAQDAMLMVFGTGSCGVYSNWIEDWSYGVQY